MSWLVTRGHHVVAIGKFSRNGSFVDSPVKHALGLLHGRINKDPPVGEHPKHADTFINQFTDAKGQFLAHDFRTPELVHSSPRSWWSQMTYFLFPHFEVCLERLGLYHVVRNAQFGLPHNSINLFCILVIYNVQIHTFFTPIRELEFALHEMHEISALSIGETPYEEYVPA